MVMAADSGQPPPAITQSVKASQVSHPHPKPDITPSGIGRALTRRSTLMPQAEALLSLPKGRPVPRASLGNERKRALSAMSPDPRLRVVGG